MFKKIFLKKRNFLIILISIICSLEYFNIFGFNAKPIIFTAIVLFVSFLYSGIFDVYIKDLAEKTKRLLDNKVNVQNIDSYTEIINIYLKRIKSKAKKNVNFLLISKFMDEIVEFEKVFPKLVDNYKRGENYLANNNVLIQKEIKQLEKKLLNSSGQTKEMYEKALEEKNTTLSEVNNIRVSMDETESKLNYFLSTLQKIEASMESVEVGQALTDQETTDFTNEFEAFSDVIKEERQKLTL